MVSTYTPNLALEIPAHGDYAAPGWDNPMDNSLRALDTSYGTYLGLTLSGGTHQLTTTEASSPVIGIGGTLSGNQSIYFPPISGHRVLLVGLTFNGYSLYVYGNNGSGDAITIPPGTPDTFYSIYVYPWGVSWANASAAGSLNVNTLTVNNNLYANNASVSGTLSLNNLTIPGSLTVSGAINCGTFYNNPTFTGNVTINGNLGVYGSNGLQVGANLGVSGAIGCSTFWSNPTFTGNVQINGQAQVNGNFVTNGTMYANNNLQVTNSASCGGNMSVGNNLVVGYNAYQNNYYLGISGGINFIQFSPQWVLNWRQGTGLLWWATTAGAVFQLQGSGALFIAGALTQNSDAASKTNIATFDDDPLAIVERVTPKRFNRLATPERRELGFIAQDVQAVLPEAVRQAEEGGNLGITESSLVAVLWRAVQKLSAEVATLKARMPA